LILIHIFKSTTIKQTNLSKRDFRGEEQITLYNKEMGQKMEDVTQTQRKTIKRLENISQTNLNLKGEIQQNQSQSLHMNPIFTKNF